MYKTRLRSKGNFPKTYSQFLINSNLRRWTQLLEAFIFLFFYYTSRFFKVEFDNSKSKQKKMCVCVREKTNLTT